MPRWGPFGGHCFLNIKRAASPRDAGKRCHPLARSGGRLSSRTRRLARLTNFSVNQARRFRLAKRPPASSHPELATYLALGSTSAGTIEDQAAMGVVWTISSLGLASSPCT